MKNLISIIEIPTADFNRALTFYRAVLNMPIEEMEMGGLQMGVLPVENDAVNVVLVYGEDYRPDASSTLLYWNADDKIEAMLDIIVEHGGQVLLPRTEISPEMGYYALFIDSEGNRMGLHGS